MLIPPTISNRKDPMKPGVYSAWRTQRWQVELRDDRDGAPPEKLLQAVWLRQRIRRDALTTTDGRKLRVLHPGFWNREPGPDFRNAVIQIDGETPRSGDVEIDLATTGWRQHGHDRNPAFEKVVLHVVWQFDGEGKASTGSRPMLQLRDFLDASLDDLRFALGEEQSGELPEEFRGQCSAPLRALEASRLEELLHQAAQVRLEAKAANFTARARQVGWDQTLWEGLFAALGYKHNVWPFRRLAELLPSFNATADPGAVLGWQARLFGLSGLLPHEIGKGRAHNNAYVQRLWEIWWRERDACSDRVLPRSLWRLAGLRPANQPARRLALAAHWLAPGDLPRRLEKWHSSEIKPSRLVDSLGKILQGEPDDFWSHHLTFQSARSAKPVALLGSARVTDLAINVVLPWFWARCEAGGSPAPKKIVAARYFDWPPADDNSASKQARQRLLGNSRPSLLRTPADQQGLLQIVRDFCQHSNSLCEHCRFPELVTAWVTT